MEKNEPDKILDFIEEDDAEALQRADRFEQVLTNLRYEGKPSFGKNLRQAHELLDFFNKELIEHVTQEEEVVFPFLKSHLPKLEPFTLLLESEHEDFRKNLEGFKFLLEEVRKEKSDCERIKLIEKIQSQGTYLIYLLRNHIRTEREVIYKLAQQELRPDEKGELARQVSESKKRGGLR